GPLRKPPPPPPPGPWKPPPPGPRIPPPPPCIWPCATAKPQLASSAIPAPAGITILRMVVAPSEKLSLHVQRLSEGAVPRTFVPMSPTQSRDGRARKDRSG